MKISNLLNPYLFVKVHFEASLLRWLAILDFINRVFNHQSLLTKKKEYLSYLKYFA